MKIRKFGGLKYRLADTVIGKRFAQSRAKGFRDRGDKARVVQIGYAFQIWVRDKLVK